MSDDDYNIVGATITFSGIVQGVGFRPSVYRAARKFNLNGSVRNTDQGVSIEVEGRKSSVTSFYREMADSPPRLAEITDSTIDWHSPAGLDSFTIIRSEEEGSGYAPVSPDIATCGDCLREILDPTDRRHRYPFTNCTNCGPRFTIVRAIPYDRKNTTMSEFEMCSRCSDEYGNPDDRRYHAQPNACPVCGPELTLLYPDGGEARSDPLTRSIGLLQEGRIIAIKGLGGYHLSCDPKNHGSVVELRNRKKRPGKPFALMVRDLDTALKYCSIGLEEKKLLLSPQRPIVLVEGKSGTTLSREVAPDTKHLGVMLPYTPLHHLLLTEGPEILVMTSANLSEEPLFFRDKDAKEGLTGIADAMLTHNREIQRPCDDSVVMVAAGMTVPLRRSRGYVPKGIVLGIEGKQMFAAGASEKNTFCVFREGTAYMSHYIGDLDNEPSVDAYTTGVIDFLEMFRIEPAAVSCDLHPDYMSTLYTEKLSQRLRVPLHRIQHHHAHIASVLGELKRDTKVIGIAFDGTGYGDDGCIWGGEFLVADRRHFTRAGRFSYVQMPGGDRSILEIDRMAIAWLLEAYGSGEDIPEFGFMTPFERERVALFEGMMRQNINCPATSSCGRLFDAVSALLGLCRVPVYDAQGAILLEREAGRLDPLVPVYTYTIDPENVIRFDGMVREIVEELRGGIDRSSIARRFHLTLIRASADLCDRIRSATGIETVVMSGGVFQNRIILDGLYTELESRGYTVCTNSVVPPNDGGIALGQTVVALGRTGNEYSRVGGM
jgi:hydrogenase maturation protein HypF